MLAEKLEGLLTKVLFAYRQIDDQNIFTLVIAALSSREAGQANAYTNNANSLRNTIRHTLQRLDKSLDEPQVVNLFANSSYTARVLPRSVLLSLHHMLQEDMDMASSSSEARILYGIYDNSKQRLSATYGTLRGLGLIDSLQPDDMIRFRVMVPDLQIQRDLSRVAAFAQNIDELVLVTSEYFLGAPHKAIASHLSASNLTIYLDLLKDYAPVFISIWNTCLETAMKVLEHRKVKKDLRGAGVEDDVVALVEDRLETQARDIMMKSIDMIGESMASESRGTEIKGRVTTTIKRAADAAANGMVVTVETDINLSKTLAGEDPPAADPGRPSVQSLIERTSELQLNLDQLMQALELDRAAPIERLPPPEPQKLIEHKQQDI